MIGRQQGTNGTESRGAARGEREWITALQVSRVLACHPTAVPKLVRAGLLTTRKLPGCAARYRREDVEHLARRSTRAADPAALERAGAIAAG